MKYIEVKYTGKNTFIEDEIYYEVGKKLIENKDALLGEFIDKKIYKYSSILEKLEGKKGETIDKKKKKVSAINKLEKLK